MTLYRIDKLAATMRPADLLRTFLLALQAASYKPSTVRRHSDAVTLFMRAFPALPVEEITHVHIRSFLANPTWSDNTRLIYFKGLKAFFGFAVQELALDANPMDRVQRPPAGPPRRPPIYTDADFQTMLAACPPWTPLGLRDRALLYVLWTTPARVSEIANIDLGEIDWEKMLLKLHGKGGVIYGAVIWPEAGLAIDRYMRVRTSESPYLFLNKNGEQMTPHAIQQVLLRIKEKSGLVKKLYPHAFRHNMGVRTVRWGLPLVQAKNLMGHRSEKSTLIYQQWEAEESALERMREIAQRGI